MAYPLEETMPRPTKDRGPVTLPAAGAGGSGRRVRPSVADHTIAHRGAQVRGAGGCNQDDAGRRDAADAHGTRGVTPTSVVLVESTGSAYRSEEHTSELQSHHDLVCR